MAPTTSQTSKHLIRFTRYIPILSWLPRYDRAWLTVDVIAGLTLWGLVVPEAMAYAGIAGLPPEAGLYTLLAALIVYALLGSVAAGGPDGAGGLALETAGGEQRMLFKNGGAAPK